MSKNIRAREKSESKSDKGFWSTIPGIITAIAALITALGGCAAIFLSDSILSRLFPLETPTPEVFVITATLELIFQPTDVVDNTDSLPTAEIPTAVIPKAYDFQACPAGCNGQNYTNNFAEAITKIYVQFNYENFESSAPYTRIWKMNGREWIRYSCNWDGPSSGVETLKLTEPKGLASGTWELTVLIDNVPVLTEEIVVVGDWDYWSPGGIINACHGTN
jgi:hypothetical protein